MIKPAGAAMSGDVYCTQAGIPMDKMPAGKAFNGTLHEAFQRARPALRAVRLRRRQRPDRGDEAGQLGRAGHYLPQLQKVGFKGVTGNIAFDRYGDSRDGGVALYQFSAGKLGRAA